MQMQCNQNRVTPHENQRLGTRADPSQKGCPGPADSQAENRLLTEMQALRLTLERLIKALEKNPPRRSNSRRREREDIVCGGALL